MPARPVFAGQISRAVRDCLRALRWAGRVCEPLGTVSECPMFVVVAVVLLPPHKTLIQTLRDSDTQAHRGTDIQASAWLNVESDAWRSDTCLSVRVSSVNHRPISHVR